MTGITCATHNSGLGVVSLAGGSWEDYAISPASAEAVYSLADNGEEILSGSFSGSSTVGRWLVPASSRGLYEARVTVTSGALSSGTVGSWVTLEDGRRWGVTRSGVGSASASFTVEIRRIGDGGVVATAGVTLTATVTFGGSGS